MIKKIIHIIWHSLAVFGLISIISLLAMGVYVVKSYHYPPQILVQKALEKFGMESSAFAQLLKPSPARPDGLSLPDPASPDWKGLGARNDRILEPVLYEGNGRPFPREWLGKTEIATYSIQGFTRKIAVRDARELIAAIKKAEPGDMIILAPGIYKIAAYNIEVLRPGTLQTPICVRAERLGDVVIQMNSHEGFHVMAPYWIFENLDIEGTNPDHDQAEHAFHVSGKAKGFVLRNCRLHEFNAMIKGNGGKDSSGNMFYPDDALIESNSFYNAVIRNTRNPVTFIDLVGPDNWIIRGNFIADFSRGKGDTISYAAFAKGNSSGTIFEGNLVIGEYRHTGGVRVGLSLGGGGTGKPYFRNGITTVEHTNGTIRNNVIMYCTDVGIYLNKSRDTKIMNNLLYKTMGIDVRFPQSSARIENNILTARVSNRDGGTSVLNNNVMIEKGFFGTDTAAKWFQNPVMADFSLKTGKQIIDNGHPSLDVFEDICGNPRKKPSDIGPFEYNGLKACSLIGLN